MNFKLTNEVRENAKTKKKRSPSTIKEERRRTGRYISILVGICLFLLAIYHAWVRKIPVIASLVVPALIMFVYVGWVLYTASRDKHRLLDAEAALQAASSHEETEVQITEVTNHNEAPKDKQNTPEESSRSWTEIVLKREIRTDDNRFIMPIILVNDKPPDDLDQKWLNILEVLSNNEKFRNYHSRRKFKRKFCRSRRYAPKRSYSIG